MSSRKRNFGVGLTLIGLVVFIGLVLSPRQAHPKTPLVRRQPAAIDKLYRLTVPKLGITAPVILNVSGADEKLYFQSLEHGVAHYAGTNLPGEVGNSVIFGHSSYYKNKPGDYKEIFKTLDRLTQGDSIVISYGRKTWHYKVSDSKVVAPDDLSVIERTDSKTLTLITCWPPGTIEKRYVVRAVLP